MKPIELITKSLGDWFRDELRQQGYKEVNPDSIKMRVSWRRVEGAWRQDVDVLVGVKVLDDPEGLLD